MDKHTHRFTQEPRPLGRLGTMVRQKAIMNKGALLGTKSCQVHYGAAPAVQRAVCACALGLRKKDLGEEVERGPAKIVSIAKGGRQYTLSMVGTQLPVGVHES